MDFGGFFDKVKGPAGQVFRGLYGPQGGNDPRVAGNGNDTLRAGLTQGGLAMMLGGGQGMDFLSLLAQGMLASQQGATMFQQNQLQMQNQMELAQLAQGPVTPENLGRMMMSAIGAGNIDAARTISEVLKSQMANRTAIRPRTSRDTILNPETGTYHRVAIDDDTQEIIRDFGPARPTGVPTYQPTLDPQGNMVMAMVDPSTVTSRAPGTGTPTVSLVPSAEGAMGAAEGGPMRVGTPPTQAQQALVPHLRMMPQALEGLDTFLDPEQNPGRFERWPAMRGWNELASDETQMLVTLGNQMAEAWLRATTGAAYTQIEYDNAFKLFVPTPGDSVQLLEIKSRNRRALFDALQEMASGRRYTVTVIDPETNDRVTETVDRAKYDEGGNSSVTGTTLVDSAGARVPSFRDWVEGNNR